MARGFENQRNSFSFIPVAYAEDCISFSPEVPSQAGGITAIMKNISQNPVAKFSLGCVIGVFKGLWNATGGAVIETAKLVKGIGSGLWQAVTHPVGSAKKLWEGASQTMEAVSSFFKDFSTQVKKIYPGLMNMDAKLVGDLLCQTASTLGTGVLIAYFTAGAGAPAALAAITQVLSKFEKTEKFGKVLTALKTTAPTVEKDLSVVKLMEPRPIEVKKVLRPEPPRSIVLTPQDQARFNWIQQALEQTPHKAILKEYSPQELLTVNERFAKYMQRQREKMGASQIPGGLDTRPFYREALEHLRDQGRLDDDYLDKILGPLYKEKEIKKVKEIQEVVSPTASLDVNRFSVAAQKRIAEVEKQSGPLSNSQREALAKMEEDFEVRAAKAREAARAEQLRQEAKSKEEEARELFLAKLAAENEQRKLKALELKKAQQELEEQKAKDAAKDALEVARQKKESEENRWKEARQNYQDHLRQQEALTRQKDPLGGTLSQAQRSELDDLRRALTDRPHALTSLEVQKIKKWVADRDARIQWQGSSKPGGMNTYFGIHPEERERFDQFSESLKKVQKDYEMRLNSSQAHVAEQQNRNYKAQVTVRDVRKDDKGNPEVHQIVERSSRPIGYRDWQAKALEDSGARRNESKIDTVQYRSILNQSELESLSRQTESLGLSREEILNANLSSMVDNTRADQMGVNQELLRTLVEKMRQVRTQKKEGSIDIPADVERKLESLEQSADYHLNYRLGPDINGSD